MTGYPVVFCFSCLCLPSLGIKGMNHLVDSQHLKVFLYPLYRKQQQKAPVMITRGTFPCNESTQQTASRPHGLPQTWLQGKEKPRKGVGGLGRGIGHKPHTFSVLLCASNNPPSVFCTKAGIIGLSTSHLL